ncbi:leucine/isoleucine/valine transporter permease subunit [compost metagenome]
MASFKIFVFCIAAAFSAIGGAMFALQVGFMSPSFVGIVPSIEMVIFAAVGGRMSLLGAVYGALLVNYGKTYFSESFPELWLYLMGGLFIAVVMYFPNGLAGLWDSHGRQALGRLLRRPSQQAAVAEPLPEAPRTAPPAPAPERPSLETQP